MRKGSFGHIFSFFGLNRGVRKILVEFILPLDCLGTLPVPSRTIARQFISVGVFGGGEIFFVLLETVMNAIFARTAVFRVAIMGGGGSLKGFFEPNAAKWDLF